MAQTKRVKSEKVCRIWCRPRAHVGARRRTRAGDRWIPRGL